MLCKSMGIFSWGAWNQRTISTRRGTQTWETNRETNLAQRTIPLGVLDRTVWVLSERQYPSRGWDLQWPLRRRIRSLPYPYNPPLAALRVLEWKNSKQKHGCWLRDLRRYWHRRRVAKSR